MHVQPTDDPAAHHAPPTPGAGCRDRTPNRRVAPRATHADGRRRARLRWLLALAFAWPAMHASPSFAADWPERAVRIVVPFAPGGNVDIVARIVAQGLSDGIGQPVVVENKPGANAAIGAEVVAHATPDGYTLLFGTAETHALNPHLRKSLPYDPQKDFVSIGMVDRFPFSLVVSPGLGATTLPAFVELAKARNGALNYASWGNGSTSQIAFEQLKQSTGMRLEHVPFKGAAPAITAVAAGDVEAFVVPLSVARPQATSSRVRLLAVLSATREAAAPDLPTATEQGVPVVIDGWHVLAAPRATAAAVVERINDALNRALAQPALRSKLENAGVTPVGGSAAQADATVRAEFARWGDVARKAGIEPN